MARQRYNAEKRRRELEKQRKKKEKRERLQQRRAGTDESPGDEVEGAESSPEPRDGEASRDPDPAPDGPPSD